MKKYVFLTLCLSAILFSKALLGVAIRAAVLFQSGLELAYRSMQIEEGRLVFSDLVLFDDSFHAHVEKVYVDFDFSSWQGSIMAERPRVSILKIKSIEPKNDSSRWTLTVNDGTLEWEGLAHFSYDAGHLAIDWEDAGLDLITTNGGSEAQLRGLNVRLLAPFCPGVQFFKGRITGRAVFDTQTELESAHVKLEEIALETTGAGLENLEAIFSYNADLGGKWELKATAKALGETIPISSEGKGFLSPKRASSQKTKEKKNASKEGWIESIVHFETNAFCTISSNTNWTLECSRLKAEHVKLLQSFVSLVFPEANKIQVEKGEMSAKACIGASYWNVDFEGKNLFGHCNEFPFVCEKGTGHITQNGGDIKLVDKDYSLHVYGLFSEWKMEVAAFGGQYTLNAEMARDGLNIQIEQGRIGALQFQGKGFCDWNLNAQLSVSGEMAFMDQKIPFYIPVLSKEGNLWRFDGRVTSKTWDLARLCGHYSQEELFFNGKSHLLGSPIVFSSQNGHSIDASVTLSKTALSALSPMLSSLKLPKYSEPSEIRLHYEPTHAEIALQSALGELRAQHKDHLWQIDLNANPLSLSVALQDDGSVKGKGHYKDSEAAFTGKLTKKMGFDLSLTHVIGNLSDLSLDFLKGSFKGQGHLVYQGQLEADFDGELTQLELWDQALENNGQVHVAYSASKGVQIRGVDLHGPIDCIIDLVEYSPEQTSLHKVYAHVPKALLNLSDEGSMNFVGDVVIVEEGITAKGNLDSLQDVHLFYNGSLCDATFTWEGFHSRMHCKKDQRYEGVLTLGDEPSAMKVDFSYDKELKIHTIEGAFCGVEASFFEDGPKSLLGNMKVDFSKLCKILPSELAEVFQEIKMGSGYELKGRLKIDQNSPSFQGHLAGKQIELFGYEFKTLFASLKLSEDCVQISNVLISDSAGSMKIDHLQLMSTYDEPWTIAIDVLKLEELRPSLLKKCGKSRGSISPLVIREFELRELSGLLDESDTWTAEGNLRFINSYKREETVFDAPAKVLSSIVGLDLELLIPVRGDLTFDLKEGKFHLLELTNAFSEADRSQFFLEMNPAPTMDLEGRLQIFIKMKQFVLLKLTESFLISLNGQLGEPKFNLQKRSLFGL